MNTEIHIDAKQCESRTAICLMIRYTFDTLAHHINVDVGSHSCYRIPQTDNSKCFQGFDWRGHSRVTRDSRRNSYAKWRRKSAFISEKIKLQPPPPRLSNRKRFKARHTDLDIHRCLKVGHRILEARSAGNRCRCEPCEGDHGSFC